MHDGVFQPTLTMDGSAPLPPASRIPEPLPADALRVTVDAAVNYAFQQNAIPILHEIWLRNGPSDRKNLTLRVSPEPAFAAPIELAVPKLAAHAEFRWAPVDLKLSHDFLAALPEKLQGWLKVEVLEDGVVIGSQTRSVALLAPHEWCGLTSLPEILAAFVLPNDPALIPILTRAADLLRTSTGRSALNGYQDKSRKRAWEQIAAIYKATSELGLRYISAPPSFEESGQKVAFPARILAERFGTCLDFTLLFAACCERVGLHPLVLLHEGHAYPGCWLEARTLDEPARDDLQHFRKLQSEDLITVFESTIVATENPGTLRDAELLGTAHLNTELPFRLGLDIRRAREARILPLPLPGAARPADEAPASLSGSSETPGIGTRDLIDGVASTAAGDSPPATRIDLWKSRLLDLSLRNRLLNFKETKTTLRVLSAAPEQVEDQLASDRVLTLHPKPRFLGESDPRDAALLTQQQRADAASDHLRDELAQGRLHTPLDEDEHARRLTELYRAARNALDENGTNTLFLAVGLLEWRETEHSERILQAPLLLIPVELRRKSVLEGFSLRRIDDDVRLNVTLMEMLRQHFQKEIPGLDPLPGDENGVHVGRVFQLFRDAVRDLPGWEVKSEIWLGQFSFTKFLLWKDLADRLEELTRNRIVRHLVHEAGMPYSNPAGDVQPGDLDDRFQPRDLLCPRSADSSQLAAVMAAAAGQDFVLEGPPGTGKSQTITNLIAHCIAQGKRVLFVAEKRAALDVVHRRLREIGLEPFCLELHSNKAGKADVIEQFRQSLECAAEAPPAAWEQRAAELATLRSELNAYTRALHRPTASGLTAYDCLDHLLARRDEPIVRLDETLPQLETSAESVEQARQLARQLQERARPLGTLADHPLSLLECQEWSPRWADRAGDLFRELDAAIVPALDATAAIHQTLGLGSGECSRDHLARIHDLAGSLLSPEPVGPSFASASWEDIAVQLDIWIAQVRERSERRTQLKGYDERQLLALDLGSLSASWQAAQASWFLPRWNRSSALRRLLGSIRKDQQRPPTAALSEILESGLRLQALRSDLDGAARPAEALLGVVWALGEPSAESLEKVRTWGEPLHQHMRAVAGKDPARLAGLQRTLARLFREPAEAGSEFKETLRRFRETWTAFDAAYARFATEVSLRRASLDQAPDHLKAVQEQLRRLAGAFSMIREWCSWQRACRDANAAGLTPVVQHLASSPSPSPEASGLFERSFRRALLFAVIDREPALREFFGPEHNERIGRFRALDDTMTSLTRGLIRARLAAAVPGEQTDAALPKAELGVLRKEMGKKARHLPVRQLLSRIPNLLPRLKPCVLMSPLSVAQYLDASQSTFDLVVFDEASQIPVWDAIGAIARGRQVVVVGDPKQLPPTNFFSSSGDADDETIPDEHADLESILDELLSHQVRTKRLRWHYRSRHEALITFSNRQYYGNDLLTFPSPELAHRGVQFRHLPAALYDKGRSRTNRGEAEALVRELVERLVRTEGAPRSYGIVTFSQAQQRLVEDLLDEERRRHPEIERHFADTCPVEGEPVFVKNLENVQGDERDVVFFSICYGPDESGRVSMNFGPLNRDGGERRLNVAITRAKHEIVVISGLRGDQIDLTRTRSRGVRDLKLFLDYAERGPRALATAVNASGEARPESEFERLVAGHLRASGFDVHHQVGCSGYRIDLAVVDPASPGRYLLGIECDGATYHGAATARDRDKLRQLILEGLGWTLHRIWSTDWWHHPDAEMTKLTAALDAAKSRGSANP